MPTGKGADGDCRQQTILVSRGGRRYQRRKMASYGEVSIRITTRRQLAPFGRTIFYQRDSESPDPLRNLKVGMRRLLRGTPLHAHSVLLTRAYGATPETRLPLVTPCRTRP